MPAVDLTALVQLVARVVVLAGGTLHQKDIRVECLPAPHKRPQRLPVGTQAVYAFFLGERCLKVGKAGPKSEARFTSQHYGVSARSTLAKSVLKHPKRVDSLLQSSAKGELHQLDESSVGAWLEQNTSRLHMYVPSQFGRLVLSLAEAVLQVRFDPIFEERTA